MMQHTSPKAACSGLHPKPPVATSQQKFKVALTESRALIGIHIMASFNAKINHLTKTVMVVGYHAGSAFPGVSALINQGTAGTYRIFKAIIGLRNCIIWKELGPGCTPCDKTGTIRIIQPLGSIAGKPSHCECAIEFLREYLEA